MKKEKNTITGISKNASIRGVEVNQSISSTIRNRIQTAGKSFLANDNISEFIKEGELEILQEEIQNKMQGVLDSLVIDTNNDHNTNGTAKRVAKMYVQELFRGRYVPAPTMTDFPNVKKYDDLYIIGPIHVRSCCSHHFVPILGSCWIGIISPARLKGLSKFNRLTDWFCRRPQIQEEATVMLADYLEKEVDPKGLAIVIKATHLCVKIRGVNDSDSEMLSSCMRGAFKDNAMSRQEFLSLIKGMNF